jgi:hypothetical protein
MQRRAAVVARVRYVSELGVVPSAACEALATSSPSHRRHYSPKSTPGQDLREQHAVPVCQSLRAAPIDAQVAAAFLEAVAPVEIDALSRARKAQRRTDEALRHAEEQQVQRLRYQATLGERQFNRVDADNRLVAGELLKKFSLACSQRRQPWIGC